MRKLLLGIGLMTIALLMSFVVRTHRTNTMELESKRTILNQLGNASLLAVTTGNENRTAYFGELHLHTTWSFDAFVGSSFNTIDDAYRYAKGEPIQFVDQEMIQLQRPLDFMAVTDHAEYMGSWAYFEENGPNPVSDGYEYNDDGSANPGLLNSIKSFLGMFIGVTDQSIYSEEAFINTWEATIQKADEYYDPGTFTTFPAFEWTSGFPRLFFVANNHRNVIFESSYQLPETPFTFLDGNNDAELLWEYMQTYRDNSGKDVLAIPHNMNISDGEFFKIDVEASEEYLAERQFNEPIFEVVQNKGQSMSHPYLSPNDEFADYRLWTSLFGIPNDFSNPGEGGSVTPVRNASLPTSYVRAGLKRGLQIQKNKAVNPFKVGFIGSSDDHEGITLKEFVENDRLNIIASSLAVVWAEENSRESIYSALRRKETYATTGSRPQVRFFSGWDLPREVNFENPGWISQACAGGVPMGGDVLRLGNEHPGFLVWAMKDPESAGLDRIQVIKVWIDAELEDERQEKIYNVAWSDDRILDGSGNLPPVIDTNGLNWDEYDHSEIGAVTLHAEWEDPDFDPEQHAAYYLRVLEVPNMFLRTQERAWSSPIYYNPDEDQVITATQGQQSISFELYPNPVTSGGTILIRGIQTDGQLIRNIKLANITGQVEQEWRVLDGSATDIRIEIEAASTGVYLLVINDHYAKQLVVH